ncbi:MULTISPECIES: hypothetical protein [Aminobacterium]|uniref:hypothetical protein n=1 Tax=Aminobacterium sp. UBA4908 TaxID=1946024 RepID=UPI00257CC988|nr:hypothetical protein [Aminobacterium sp. UBA4908]
MISEISSNSSLGDIPPFKSGRPRLIRFEISIISIPPFFSPSQRPLRSRNPQSSCFPGRNRRPFAAGLLVLSGGKRRSSSSVDNGCSYGKSRCVDVLSRRVPVSSPSRAPSRRIAENGRQRADENLNPLHHRILNRHTSAIQQIVAQPYVSLRERSVGKILQNFPLRRRDHQP